MNQLTIFSNDIIPVYTTDAGSKVVIGRELHDKLRIGKDYSTWFKDMCDYGFEADKDFSPFSGKTAELGGRPRIEHVLKFDMAKHIAMIQRTNEGFRIRQKLIEIEQKQTVLSPIELLELQVKAMRDMEGKLEIVERKLENIGDVIALNTQSWRADARKLIVRIAQKMGGNEFIEELNKEIFRLIDLRAGSKLDTRLTNKRKTMALEGVCKSKRDKLTRIDVISEDKKLIEIYMAIVKEMAIKHKIAG